MDGNRFFESVYDGSGQRVVGCVGSKGRTSNVHGCPVVLGVIDRVCIPIDGCFE